MELWCNICDMNLVDSGDQSTGKFFVVGGHKVFPNHILDQYGNVIFSICSDCNPVDTLRELSAETLKKLTVDKG